MGSKVINQISVVCDGLETLGFLPKRLEFTAVATPDTVLPDINLPRIDGKEMLSMIKKDNQQQRIPVWMLTSTWAESDIIESYDNYAHCYITQPLVFHKFTQAIRTIEDCWPSIVQLSFIK